MCLFILHTYCVYTYLTEHTHIHAYMCLYTSHVSVHIACICTYLTKEKPNIHKNLKIKLSRISNDVCMYSYIHVCMGDLNFNDVFLLRGIALIYIHTYTPMNVNVYTHTERVHAYRYTCIRMCTHIHTVQS
jgi:hypothetical protein